MSENTAGLPQTQAADDPQAVSADKASEVAEKLLNQLTRAFGTAPSNGAGQPRFFPAGIDLLHIRVEVHLSASAKGIIDVKLAGPKAPAS